MPADETANFEMKSNDLVKKLYDRAESLMRLSYGYLSVMVLLILVAILVFFSAAQVTKGDIAQRAETNQQSLEIRLGEIAKLEREAQHTESRYRVESTQALLAFLGKSQGIHFGNETFGPAVTCCEGSNLLFSEIADQIQDAVNRAVPNERGIYTISLELGIGQPATGFLTKAGWAGFIGALRSLKEPLTDDDISRWRAAITKAGLLNDEYQRLSRTLNEVQRQEAETDAGRLLGRTAANGVETADTRLQLIQTSVTRFGTITLIVFLVSIVSSLYRYTVKLAAFYRAQADALYLLSAETAQLDITSLSAILTPKLDFGKTPSTPINQIAELVKAIRIFDTKNGSA